MDIPIEIVACSKSIAMSPDDPAELMIDLLIPLNRPLDAPRLRKATYRIRLKESADDTKLPDIPETTMQKILSRSDDHILLEVGRVSTRVDRHELTDAERASCLTASEVLNYRDPRIAELVKKAAGDETNPHRLAERFCRFVGQHVNSKGLNVGFATASEVARSREGDCTEHGVLLAAMGRAKKIPTRLVTGLVYAPNFGGKSDVLVGHLWTQFWIDDRWVDFDAALGQTDVDPTHIALAVTPADNAGFADLISSTWLSIGKWRIEVVALDPNQ